MLELLVIGSLTLDFGAGPLSREMMTMRDLQDDSMISGVCSGLSIGEK